MILNRLCLRYIIARGIEYSPFGFLKTVMKLAQPLAAAPAVPQGLPLLADPPSVCNREAMLAATSQEHSCSTSMYKREDAGALLAS